MSPFRTERSKQCGTCRLVTYPLVSPAIIVPVQRDNRILPARSPGFSPTMFGLVTGFVDPGEDLEHALVRELLKKPGLRLKNIRYFGSGHWPFPNSHRVGFTVYFYSGELVVDTTGIESAFWFDR